MRKEFKKSDLRSGMVVENRQGQRSLVLLNAPEGDMLVGDDNNEFKTWMPLSSLTNDLTYSNTSFKYDIVKVYDYTNNSSAATFSAYRELLWAREEDTVELNGEYIAEIKDGYVQVGCQQIPFEAVNKLYKLINK